MALFVLKQVDDYSVFPERSNEFILIIGVAFPLTIGILPSHFSIYVSLTISGFLRIASPFTSKVLI